MRTTKAFSLVLLFILLVNSITVLPGASLAAEPTPPAQTLPVDGPLDGAEADKNPFYPALAGDHPQDPDWYQLPPQAFEPRRSNLPTAGVMQVVGGLGHTCALTTTGGVKCWGDNWEGKLGDGSVVNSSTPVDVVGLSSGVAAIATSHKHSCALTESGAMKCWGRNWHGELGDGTTEYRVEAVDVYGLGSGVKGIAVGGFHTCALLVDGNIKCWGANWHGQVGDDSKVDRYLPVYVVGLGAPAVAVTAGKYHTCALLQTGGVQCWGYNLYGQLGNESQIDRPVPQDVKWLSSGIQAITAGENHTCALSDLGEVLCWGNNAEGELGTGDTLMQLAPVFTQGLEAGITAIQAGMRYTCGTTSSGAVRCWGENWAGQLGDGGQLGQLLPVAVSGLPAGVTNLAAGDSHTCAVLVTQGLMCWGSNSFGQIGNGESAVRSQPVDVVGLTNGIQTIVSGGLHSCALTTAGAVKCWGSNKFGQLGNGTTIDSLTPVDVFSLDHGVAAITAGGFHTCAAFQEEVRCWGYNEFGQVGDGSRVTRLTPEKVSGIANAVSAVSAGANHTCALIRDSQRLKCWGQNKNGQLGNGSKNDSAGALFVEGVDGLRFASLTTGDRHTCAATINGSVLCWGFNGAGQLGDGTLEIRTLPVYVLDIYNEVAQVTAGDSHTCGRTFEGGVKCWGDNTYGELGDGTTYRSLTPVSTNGLGGTVINISAGYFHTCAVLADYSVQCWGNNQAGQLGDGTTFMRINPTYVSGLSAPVGVLGSGSYTTCAVSIYGSAQCWGSHANGQAGDGSLPWVLAPSEVSELIMPHFSINYANGKPGSFFTIHGEDLPSEAAVNLKANNVFLTPSTITDPDGKLVILLDTSLADPGSYVITVIINKAYNLNFKLDDAAPLRAQEGSGVIYQIPGGIAMNLSMYLPFNFR